MLRVGVFTEVAQCFGFHRGAHMQGSLDCHCHISARDFDQVLITGEYSYLTRQTKTLTFFLFSLFQDIDEVIQNAKKVRRFV